MGPGPPTALATGVSCGNQLALTHLHREAIERLKAGASHPAREQLLRMAAFDVEAEESWQTLTDEEREIACSVEDEAPPDLPAAVKVFSGLQASCQEILGEVAGRRASEGPGGADAAEGPADIAAGSGSPVTEA